MLAIWSLVLVLSKLLSYVAFAACVGAGLVYVLIMFKQRQQEKQQAHTAFRVWLRQLFKAFAVMGIIVAALQLPLQAGALAENGLVGMLNQIMLNIIWQSAIGTQGVIRIIGFIILLLVMKVRPQALQYIVGFVGALLIAYSFTLTGHTVQLANWVQLALLLHLLAMAAWVGALWPLYQSCVRLPSSSVLLLMRRFGQFAQAFVLVLLLCGGLLLWQLVGSVTLLFSSNYGQLLLLKLLLVVGMLLLGAWHKFKLVVELASHQNTNLLRGSILIETCLALLILITTTIFTTFVGPEIA